MSPWRVIVYVNKLPLKHVYGATEQSAKKLAESYADLFCSALESNFSVVPTFVMSVFSYADARSGKGNKSLGGYVPNSTYNYSPYKETDRS